jgi:AcrR family transcriptional regulator
MAMGMNASKGVRLTDNMMVSGRGGSAIVQRTRAIQTRRSLVETATQLFGAAGFHATGTPELVAAAAVTRGALYHHFASKEGLFEAVFRNAVVELNDQARERVGYLAGDTWAQFIGALQAYLRLLSEREDLRRILLIDGPAVLGWARWHALQAERVQSGIVTALRHLRQEGRIAIADPEPLAILIQGAVNDAAMAIAHSSEPADAMIGLGNALVRLLEALRLG